MNFISPQSALIAAGITIPALVALYFLKLRRKRMVIPSTLLWQRAVQDLQVNAPFQKIKNNLLLWIQLLLLLALLIAMAQPTQDDVADPGRRVVIVIDHSASMNAADVDGKTRLEEAKRRALQVVDQIASDDEGGGVGSAMVIAVAHRASVLTDFTTDLAQVRRAIRDIEPTDQRSHLDAAIATIEPHARQGASGDNQLTAHVFSDGRVQQRSDEPLALANAKVLWHAVGDGADGSDNLALVALSARRDFENPQQVQVFARLANYAADPITTNVTINIDGRDLKVERITVPGLVVEEAPAETGDSVATEDGTAIIPQDFPGGEPTAPTVGDGRPEPGTAGIAFDFVWTGEATLRVSHDHEDLLAADDGARLRLVAARELSVLLVTEGNAYIQRAIDAAKVQHQVTMTPEQYEQQDPITLRRGGWDGAAAGATEDLASTGFDVIVFDRHEPSEVPLVNSLYFGVAPPIDGFARRPASDAAPANELITQWDRTSELLSNVELSDIPLRKPGRIVVPVDGRILAIGGEGPVMAELTRDTVRHVVVSFDVHESLWPFRISFPTFFQNVLPALGLGGATDSAGVAYHTGENATLLLDAAPDTITYTGPAKLTGRAVGNAVTVDPFPRVGLYTTSSSDVEPRDRQLMANLLDQQESDTRVASQLTIGTSAVASQSAQQVQVRKEIWPWFVWGALALLAIEWLVYTRRMHI
ncbi:MAG: BatA and WFA domain-containing protein [Planctomycetota bacterium]